MAERAAVESVVSPPKRSGSNTKWIKHDVDLHCVFVGSLHDCDISTIVIHGSQQRNRLQVGISSGQTHEVVSPAQVPQPTIITAKTRIAADRLQSFISICALSGNYIVLKTVLFSGS